MFNNEVENKKEYQQYIVFKLDDQEYGINVLDSREIITADDLTELPDSPKFIKGIINLREEIIPIIDLVQRFNLEKSLNKEDSKVIIVSVNDTLVGLAVKSVKEILRIDLENISETPEVVKKIKQNYIAGIARLDDRLLILLVLEEIFSDPERVQILFLKKYSHRYSF